MKLLAVVTEPKSIQRLLRHLSDPPSHPPASRREVLEENRAASTVPLSRTFRSVSVSLVLPTPSTRACSFVSRLLSPTSSGANRWPRLRESV
jgi:hypothetical protein